MSVLANRKTIMALYSGSLDIDSHRARIVLAEKGVTVDIVDIDAEDHAEDLQELNPYNTAPTLVDRDLVLYTPAIIMEYIDERFPHPPLLPVYPVARAKSRLMIYRVQLEWDAMIKKILKGSAAEREKAKKEFRDYLVKMVPVFSRTPYFLSDEFSLVDCFIAPILWRLDSWGITLPPAAEVINAYATRLFDRPGFKRSLTEAEQELHEVEFFI